MKPADLDLHCFQKREENFEKVMNMYSVLNRLNTYEPQHVISNNVAF